MSVKSCEKQEKSEVLLTIEVDAEAFEAAVEKAYRQKGKEIRVQGFRPGKAPRRLIERMYGKEVFYSDAIDMVWFDAYKAAVEQEKLRVVGDPKVELEGEVTENGFAFKATVPVYPEVTLGQYKGLSAPKAEVKVTAADVDAKIKELTDRNTRFVSVERAAEKGDMVVIDYVGKDDGKTFEGGSAENYSLELGSGSFVPGFEEQVVGMAIGEEKDIDITFPKDYHKDLAGKAVVFHVKLNEVKAKEVPALDDEFAKDVSEFDTLKDLKADLKKKLAEERETAAQQAFEDALMQKASENITCEVPEAMVEAQTNRMLENFRTQMQSQGIPFDQYLKLTGMTEEKIRADAAEPARKQVMVDLTLAAIIEAEKVEASDEEIEAEYADLSKKYGMDVDTVKKYLQKENVADEVCSRKAIKIVADSATATAPEEKAEEGAEKPAKKTAAKKSAKKTEAPAESGAEKPAKKPAAKKTSAKKNEGKTEEGK